MRWKRLLEYNFTQNGFSHQSQTNDYVCFSTADRGVDDVHNGVDTVLAKLTITTINNMSCHERMDLSSLGLSPLGVIPELRTQQLHAHVVNERSSRL